MSGEQLTDPEAIVKARAEQCVDSLNDGATVTGPETGESFTIAVPRAVAGEATTITISRTLEPGGDKFKPGDIVYHAVIRTKNEKTIIEQATVFNVNLTSKVLDLIEKDEKRDE